MPQVHRQREYATPDTRQYLLIVHVETDYVFQKYYKVASQADMALFRGMFLAITLTKPSQPDSPRHRNEAPSENKIDLTGWRLADISVQQAFLPKFENEGQDAAVAKRIREEANERFMHIAVKHSGSLATLSHGLMGSKNSVGNIFTAVAIVLLQEHYRRTAAAQCAPEPHHAKCLYGRSGPLKTFTICSIMKASKASSCHELIDSSIYAHSAAIPKALFLMRKADALSSIY
jgi:hypothetical protein